MGICQKARIMAAQAAKQSVCWCCLICGTGSKGIGGFANQFDVGFVGQYGAIFNVHVDGSNLPD